MLRTEGCLDDSFAARGKPLASECIAKLQWYGAARPVHAASMCVCQLKADSKPGEEEGLALRLTMLLMVPHVFV